MYSTSYRDTLESERLADCFQQRNAILESLRVTQVHLLGRGNRVGLMMERRNRTFYHPYHSRFTQKPGTEFCVSCAMLPRSDIPRIPAGAHHPARAHGVARRPGAVAASAHHQP